MFCGKCQSELSECTCPDLEERLNKAVDAGVFVYRYCKICNKHYERCKCKKPIWDVKNKEES
jgi:hypothetical protein